MIILIFIFGVLALCVWILVEIALWFHRGHRR